MRNETFRIPSPKALELLRALNQVYLFQRLNRRFVSPFLQKAFSRPRIAGANAFEALLISLCHLRAIQHVAEVYP